MRVFVFEGGKKMVNFKQIIAKKIIEKINCLKKEEIINLIEIPPDTDLGDYALPCFQLSGILKKSPQNIALELKQNLKLDKYFD